MKHHTAPLAAPAQPSVSSPSSTVEATRWLAVGVLLALMALCAVWELWGAPVRPGGSWLALKGAPLALALPGLLKRRMYTYRWLSLLLWLYCTEALVRLSSDAAPSRWWALGELLLCLALFVLCVLHVRLRHKAARQAVAQPAAASGVTH